MQFNLLICDDNDKQLFNETVSTAEELKYNLNMFIYEHDAKMDDLTGGNDE